MNGTATTRHIGRRLTGLTFGKRGRPVYARIYDKTEQAAADAPIREVWRRAGYDASCDGETVWRVEFEVRSEFLRHLATGEGHLPVEPEALLAHHLDEVWAHLVTRWLVFRDATDPNERIERRRGEAWWTALGAARGLNGDAFGSVRELSRRVRQPMDCTSYLRQVAGLLVSVAATNGSTSLEDTLAGLPATCARRRAKPASPSRLPSD